VRICQEAIFKTTSSLPKLNLGLQSCYSIRRVYSLVWQGYSRQRRRALNAVYGDRGLITVHPLKIPHVQPNLDPKKSNHVIVGALASLHHLITRSQYGRSKARNQAEESLSSTTSNSITILGMDDLYSHMLKCCGPTG
jgi:hypothetical protein